MGKQVKFWQSHSHLALLCFSFLCDKHVQSRWLSILVFQILYDRCGLCMAPCPFIFRGTALTRDRSRDRRGRDLVRLPFVRGNLNLTSCSTRQSNHVASERQVGDSTPCLYIYVFVVLQMIISLPYEIRFLFRFRLCVPYNETYEIRPTLDIF